MTLEQFVRRADTAICKRFAEKGEISPMYHFVTGDDEEKILAAPPFEKDIAVKVVRAAFKAMHVKRCLFIDEAWVVQSNGEAENKKTKEYARNNSLEFHPKRIEIIMYSAEDAHEGTVMGRREIIREDGKPARLGELEITKYGATEGRMVGLLPRTGALQ